MKKVLNLFLQTLHSPDLSPVWQMEREQIYANERQQFLVYFCMHSPGPSCHKNLSSAPYITPCEVFQIHLWVWPWLVTKLQGVKMVGKASKTPGISAHQWRISFGATWPLQGNGEKWTTHYRDAIFCMGGGGVSMLNLEIFKYFWCREKATWGRPRSLLCHCSPAKAHSAEAAFKIPSSFWWKILQCLSTQHLKSHSSLFSSPPPRWSFVQAVKV